MKIEDQNPEDEDKKYGGSRDSKIALGANSIVGNTLRAFSGMPSVDRLERRYFDAKLKIRGSKAGAMIYQQWWMKESGICRGRWWPSAAE